MENATTLQTSNGMEWTVGSGLWVSNVDLERELDGVHGINLDLVSLALGIPTRSGRSGWMTSWFDLVSWTPPPPLLDDDGMYDALALVCMGTVT